MSQSRNATLVKAVRLVTMMSGTRVRPTAPEIAAALGISLRGAKRWLQACNEAHVPMPPTVDQVSAYTLGRRGC